MTTETNREFYFNRIDYLTESLREAITAFGYRIANYDARTKNHATPCISVVLEEFADEIQVLRYFCESIERFMILADKIKE